MSETVAKKRVGNLWAWLLATAAACGLTGAVLSGLLSPTDPTATAAPAGKSSAKSAAKADDDDDAPAKPVTRPGLLAAISDGTNTANRVDASPSFAIRAGESLDPRVAADKLTARWTGVLMLPRPREYKLTLRVTGGTARLSLAGQAVTEATATAAETKEATGSAGRLEAGPTPLTVEFTRAAGAGVARLQLLWEAVDSFRREPIPATVLAHTPAQAPADYDSTQKAELGRQLAEEHNCAACHKPDGALAAVSAQLRPRVPTPLNKIGGHAKSIWVYHWLGDPQAHRPGSPMPVTIPDDELGKVERYAVARYLEGLGKAPGGLPKAPNNLKSAAALGQELFTSVGCAVCHAPSKGEAGKSDPAEARAAHVPLRGLGSKFEFGPLAHFLRNPGGHNAQTRMPNLLLTDKEAANLAAYLLSETLPAYDKPDPSVKTADLKAAWDRLANSLPAEGAKSKPADFGKLKPDEQVRVLGQAVTQVRACVNCHSVAEGAKPTPTAAVSSLSSIASAAEADTRKERERWDACLRGNAVGAPKFALKPEQQTALQAWLIGLHKKPTATVGAGSPAPLFHATAAVGKLNCLGCHVRDGQGGLTNEILETLRKYEKPENAEAVVPPHLSGVGTKIRVPWMQTIFTGARRSRPWMSLRMPQFTAAYVGEFGERMAGMDGVLPSDADRPAGEAGSSGSGAPAKFDPAMIAAGKTLVGKTGLGCIGCHYIAGRQSTGTLGPDLAMVSERLTRDWNDRWMWEPQRITPGTRMPTIHIDGRTGFRSLYDGDAGKQIDAMWAYLSLGQNLPLPEGLEQPTLQGFTLTATAKDKILVERTFLPECGERGIAVGFANGVNFGFDAYRCRVGFAWTGPFLDMKPVWDGRGGNKANPLGQTFWQSPKGFPWAVTSSEGAPPPDYAAQGSDGSINSNPWFGELPDKPRRLTFLGYAIKDGTTSFRYRLELGEKPESESVEFTETLAPLTRLTALGLARHFAISGPAGHPTWLNLAEGNGVRLVDKTGAAQEPDAGDSVEIPADGKAVLLPGAAGKPVLLAVVEAPKGSTWVLRKVGSGRTVLLRLPAAQAAGKAPVAATVKLELLLPYRDSPDVLAATLAELGKP